MSGAVEDEDSYEWQWAHILWQRHNLRMEDWANMPREVQLAYIASEQLEDKHPLQASNRMAKAYIKSK